MIFRNQTHTYFRPSINKNSEFAFQILALNLIFFFKLVTEGFFYHPSENVCSFIVLKLIKSRQIVTLPEQVQTIALIKETSALQWMARVKEAAIACEMKRKPFNNISLRLFWEGLLLTLIYGDQNVIKNPNMILKSLI